MVGMRSVYRTDCAIAKAKVFVWALWIGGTWICHYKIIIGYEFTSLAHEFRRLIWTTPQIFFVEYFSFPHRLGFFRTIVAVP